jgi:hypothetical protein
MQATGREYVLPPHQAAATFLEALLLCRLRKQGAGDRGGAESRLVKGNDSRQQSVGYLSQLAASGENNNNRPPPPLNIDTIQLF